MMNLFYRGYVIHEDIHSICYTVFDQRPNRVELVSQSTANEAMRWVDRHVVRQATAVWVDRDTARRKLNALVKPEQPALL